MNEQMTKEVSIWIVHAAVRRWKAVFARNADSP